MSHVDPGLDEPAQDAANDVEQDEEHAEAEEQDFLDPRFVIKVFHRTFSNRNLADGGSPRQHVH
jgi:hypothetical protein